MQVAAKSADSSSSSSSSASSSRSPPRRTRSIRTGRVSSRWLFNHFHVGELVVDARALDAFARGTILGALSLPPVADACESFADVERCGSDGGGCRDLARLSPSEKRKLRDVVLFADRAQLSDAASWVFTLQRLLADEGLVASVKVLGDDYADFQRRYPFYTTEGVAAAERATGAVVQSGAHLVTYPNEIIDGFLYLGNMWQAASAQVVADLGITHVVNASLDVGNVFADRGVQYHEVKLRDEPAADIARFFDAAFAFIQCAKHADASPRARVLVHCTQGISRSATLVVLYLMRAHRWSLARAFNYARAGRGVILPNDGFMRALLAEEQRLLGGNSVAEHELELLLQGALPDRQAVADSPSPSTKTTTLTLRSPLSCLVM